MSLGIQEIGVYIPEKKVSNLELKEKFNIDDTFIEKKIGVKQRAVKEPTEKASDLCVKAFENLKQKVDINKDEIDCCIVVTQNPDTPIPHTSAIVHAKLGLKENCACFDISLGCSGYVYGLAVALSFMEKMGLKKGLLFTADPYSEIIDPEDKNTVLLFGDAATVTLLSEEGTLALKKALFATEGKKFEALTIKNGRLYMNGRAVFNFVLTKVPNQIKRLLEESKLTLEDIDLFLLHPGSKYMVDMLASRLKVPKDKVPFDMLDYGNTVSSSIPLMLEKYLPKRDIKRIIISGYGVGLSWASAILERI
jgi:3-oxoacyl-[acyl-carrier-protein] synthase-3